MKTKFLLSALLTGIYTVLRLPAAETTAPQEAAVTVQERGPHHERVELVTKTLGEAGEELTQTNSYVRLETGLHYLGDGGEWEPAAARFELIPGAAVAWRGQHKVTLAANLNTAHAVQQRLPDGQLLTGQVYGLAYHDLATGETVLIAEVQDADGLLVAENQVLYPGALGLADVRYTFTKAGFEQDVILREQPPSPADYGLDPATTRLEVWTEFTGSPEPAKIREGRAAAAGAADDETLDFGSARIGTGRTFRLGAEDENLALVVKQWVTAEDDRKFLVEAVLVEALAEALAPLPAGRGGARVGRPLPSRLQALNTLPVKADGRGRQTARMRRLEAGRDDVLLAQAARPGLVVDYLTLNTSQSNYTFTSDETYYVTGAVVLTGTTTFEGGTVVKLDSSTAAKLEVQGTLAWGGAAFKPVVFSGKDDNTVGQNIAGSTGNPTTTHYGATLGTLVLNNGAATTLTHLRMNHLRRGLDYVNGTGHIVRHAQFVRCQEAVDPVNTVNLHNALFHNLTRVLAGTAATVHGQHLTVNVATHFNYNSAATVTLNNCLLVQVTTAGSYGNPNSSVAVASSGTGIFETVAGGNHYLVAGSPHRNSGTTSIDTTLAGDLKALTTEAPQVLTGTLNLDTTLRPRVARDTDTLDKGFHYVPLDYVLKQVNLTVPLRLTNGVAAAVAGTYGVDLQSGSQFLSEGRAENLNRLTRWHNVQEQSAAEGNGGPMTRITGSYGSRPTLSVRFTEVTCLSKSGTSLLELSGSSTPFYSVTLEFCQFRNAGLPSLWPTDPYVETVTLRNNLFERSVLSINKSYFSLNTPLTLVARNNLFWRGSLSITYDSGTSNPTWTVKDNLFDGTSQSLSGNLTASVSRSHNGFISGTATTYNGTNGKTGLSTDYQGNGAWGSRYYPASGSAPSLATLIDAGSQTYSVAGLTHFTVKTAGGTKEGADSLTTVDIGYHYVGLTGGVPNDTDGDGLADYVEDRDGDGVADGNETNWTVSNGVGAGSNVVLLFTPLLP